MTSVYRQGIIFLDGDVDMKFYEQRQIRLQPMAEHFSVGQVPPDAVFTSPIHIFVLTGLDRPSIDAWADAVIDRAQAWAVGEMERFIAMHDFTSIPMLTAITPYLQQRSTETMTAVPQLTGRVVIVVTDSPLVRAIGGRAAEYFMSRNMVNLKTRVMFEREDALLWLRQT